MKSISYDMRYDATPAQVFEMLKTPAFREAVCEFQGYARHNVTIVPNGDGMDVVVDQYRETTEVPSFVRKFAGAETNIVQREAWSSPSAGTLSVEIPGKPGTLTGNVSIREADGGTIETVTVDIKVGIPLVGGKIEGFLAEMLTKALRAENKVGEDWLAKHRD